MLEVTVASNKHLCAVLHSEQSTSRLHKQFRKNLVHEMVQPHLDERANHVTAVNPNENRLIGKYFAESKYPQRKTCFSCGYKKDAKGRQSRKKLATFAENVIDLFVKIVFGNTIPRAN